MGIQSAVIFSRLTMTADRGAHFGNMRSSRSRVIDRDEQSLSTGPEAALTKIRILLAVVVLEHFFLP